MAWAQGTHAELADINFRYIKGGQHCRRQQQHARDVQEFTQKGTHGALQPVKSSVLGPARHASLKNGRQRA